MTLFNRWVPFHSQLPCDPAVTSQLINKQFTMVGDTEVSFVTDGLALNEGFKIKYWVDPDLECDGTLTEASGLIDTTNLSVTDNSTINCPWKIETQVADSSKRTITTKLGPYCGSEH